MKKTETIVITGGAGFIGSHLCDHFIRLGARVICIDNLPTGSLNNVMHLKREKNFTVAIHDAFNQLARTLTMPDVNDYRAELRPDGSRVLAATDFGGQISHDLQTAGRQFDSDLGLCSDSERTG